MAISKNVWMDIIPRKAKPKRERIIYNRKFDDYDTIIVPTRDDTFKQVFMRERCWYPVRVANDMLRNIKWVAAYQSAPVSAITHIARVALVEKYDDVGKFKLMFSKAPKQIKKIPFGDAPVSAMRGPRYTTRSNLAKAGRLTDLFEKRK